MSSPLSIRLPDDLDAAVREQASAAGGTVTDVIVKALRRGLDQPDPVREGIEDVQRRVQVIMDRLDAQESSRCQAMVTAPTKPDTPVTYVLEPAGWLGRLLLGRVKLTQDRPGSSR